MKNILIILAILISLSSFSQSQIGITSGVNITSVKSEDLIETRSSAGIGVGLTTLFPLHNTSDWMLNLTYNIKGVSIDGYKDFYNQDQTLHSDGGLKIQSLDLDFIINQYFIVPEDNAFHLGIQGGIGTTLLNTWSSEELSIIKNENNFSPYYIIGLTGGTEQFRINLRYTSFLGNPLKNLVDDEIPDEFNRYDSKVFDGMLNNFSISLTYFFKTFSY